jgi:sporulation protein YtfJ
MNHPIEGLMNTAMSSIKDMIDVDTIIGEPISTGIDTLIIPISKVSFGFAAGGSEFKGETINEYSKKEKEEQVQYRLPFGGGSGAGVSIEPVAFLVVSNGMVKLLPVTHDSYVDKLIDYVPDLLEKSGEFLKNMKDKNKCVQELKDKIEEHLEEDMEEDD